MNGRQLGVAGVALVLGGALLIGIGTAVGASAGPGVGGMMGGGWGSFASGPGGMMGGAGMMGGGGPGGMMGGLGGPGVVGPGPGEPGFVAGTAAAPRVIRVIAGPWPAFSPPTIAVARGETVTFLVTTMGPTVHEFMVGPAGAVAADTPGTPEVDDIGMMQSKSITYTFSGAGPYAFACHVPGHFEAGMRGTITVVD